MFPENCTEAVSFDDYRWVHHEARLLAVLPLLEPSTTLFSTPCRALCWRWPCGSLLLSLRRPTVLQISIDYFATFRL